MLSKLPDGTGIKPDDVREVKAFEGESWPKEQFDAPKTVPRVIVRTEVNTHMFPCKTFADAVQLRDELIAWVNVQSIPLDVAALLETIAGLRKELARVREANLND